MAEALVATVLDQLASFIVEGVRDEITLVVGVDKELKKLESNFQSIRAVLADAERRQVREEVVQVWLQKLKAASFEIRDVLDEWNTAILKSSLIDDDQRKSSANKVLCFIPTSSCFCCFNHQVVLRRDIALKIKELNATLDSIASEKNRYNFTMTVEAPERHISTSSVDVSEVLGRDYDKKEIITKLLGESRQEEMGLHIITIVGMGGLGKTALAQLAYNDDGVKTHFNKRVWVCVSEPFDKIRIAKAIYEELGGNAKDVCELQTLSERIKESISGKKLLVVFDDVWTEDCTDWEPFKNCLRNGGPGSRILVTTRKEKVAGIIGTIYMHRLQLLSKEVCRMVFSEIAFRGRSNEDRQRLEGVGREIADKCKGLPLALKTLASLMRDKKTEEDWKGVLNDDVWQQEVEEADIFRPLLLSYYDLPSPLKRCFLYCAIFPKDYEISSVDVIALWMAQGYLSGSNQQNRNEMEKTGQKYFDNLVMRSLLQDLRRGTGDDDLGNYCKMHDIVHDFVKFLTKKEFFMMEIDGSRKEASMDSERRHSTVVVIRKMAPLPVLIYTAGKGLHTLRIQTHSDSYDGLYETFGALPANLFHDLKCLRALYLGFLEMTQLAEGVGKLIHLRYLNLRGNKFEILPKEVCDLCNLQTLDLSWCRNLKELPKEIWKLINLRQLDLDGTGSLSFLPKGIGRLSSLRILTKFIIGEDTVEACTIGDLGKLNHLGRELEIEGLRNVKDASEARRAELKSKRLFALHLSFDELEGRTADAVVEALQPHPNLKYLSLRSFGGTVLPNWISSLTQLVSLTLYNWNNCPSLFLFPLATLPLLEQLSIYMMISVEVVDANKKEENNKTSVPMDITAFPNLRELKFHNMYAWEEWKEAEITRMMPCLVFLRIVNCPKLKALPHYLQTTPLQELVIHRCPILKQRCQMEIGEDWHKISRIPNIYLQS